MAITQKQIAERLNISRSWVARALNDYDTVSPEMRARVHAMAQEMGYDMNANQAARSLIGQRYGKRPTTGILAVAFPIMQSPSPYHEPFYAPFLAAMQKEGVELGLDIMALQMAYGELPRLIRDRGVDGVISIGFLAHEVEQIRLCGLPVLTYQVEYKNAHSMVADDCEGMRLATRHLLELGHRDIAFLGVQRHWDTGQADALRQQGYEMALAEFDVPVRPEYIDVSLPLPDTSTHKFCVGCSHCAACMGWQALKRRTKTQGIPPFTAVVCHNDAIAMGLIHHARLDGLDVPGDLSVAGFDDISSLYHFEPHVTSVGFDRAEMGREAVRILHQVSATEAKDGTGEQPQYERRVFPVCLAVHQSTAAPKTFASIDR